jgi:secreted Zn-dependent insulinase-like peptidase
MEKLESQWKYALSVGISFDTLKEISFMEIAVQLSELGRKYTGSIIAVVLAAIKEVKKEYGQHNQYFDE